MSLQALEVALAALETSEDARKPARAVVSAVMEIHSQGLEALMALLKPDTINRLLDDATVVGMLVLHDLHPLPFAERVIRASRVCRGIALVDIQENNVRVRLATEHELATFAAHLPDANIHVASDGV